MPTYVFVDNKGERHERTMSVASLEALERWTDEINRVYDVPGLGECWIDVAAQQIEVRSTPGTYPMECDAAAVHPTQVREHQEILAKRGVKTQYTSDGRPIFRDAAHRKHHCETIGLYDRNGGYSDPQPRNH
jgi:hypothetical protein